MFYWIYIGILFVY